MYATSILYNTRQSDTQPSASKRGKKEESTSIASGETTLTSIAVGRTGKIRGTHLPQEYELAFLVENVTNQLLSWNTSTPACEWHGIKCDDGLNVSQIEWKFLISFKLEGTLRLDKIPKTVLYFDVSGNHLSGTIELAQLPQPLAQLWLHCNRFEGTVDLTHLPPNLTKLCLWHNNLSGGVDLSCLPSKITYLNLSSNKFTGSVDLEHLPPFLHALNLQDNELSGLVSFDSLPRGIATLGLSGNGELYGQTDFLILPRSLRDFSRGPKIKLFG